MLKACDLGGFFAAHTLWSISDSDGTLVPILVYTTEQGERKMERLLCEDIQTSVDLGRTKLTSNPMDANDAALIFLGSMTIEQRKTEAIFIELKSYFSPGSEATLAVPYRRAESNQFRVFQPKILQWENCEDFELNQAMGCFFEGVDDHREGSAIWLKALAE